MSRTCKIVGVTPYVLKHWEKKFGFTPTKNSAGRRIYSKEDIEKFATISHLLYRDRFTVEGAKRQFEKMKRFPNNKITKREYENALLYLKKELIALKTELSADN